MQVSLPSLSPTVLSRSMGLMRAGRRGFLGAVAVAGALALGSQGVMA